MNKKLLMLLAAGALAITGCAGKEASKTSDQKNSPEQKENKKEKTENKETASKEKAEVKHDLAAAEKLAHLVAISGNDLSKLNEQTINNKSCFCKMEQLFFVRDFWKILLF